MNGREELGRTAQLLALRPPLMFGGHCFSLSKDGYPVATCRSCHTSIPTWSLVEGMGSHFGLARWCRGMFKALS